jgi:translation initiation factor 2 alpha subunit (eIF-2alpha)
MRRSKAELVDFLLELAQADRAVLRQLTARFEVAATADELVTAVRQAIANATDFDERDINHNFDYEAASKGLQAA